MQQLSNTTTAAMNTDVIDRIALNTHNKTKWAIKIFGKWLSVWRVRCDEVA